MLGGMITAPENLSLSDLTAEALDLLTAFSIPLYIEVKRRPVLCGTGFFVNVASDCFLVSAAHVLDDAKTHRMYFHTSLRMQRQLDGTIVRSGSVATRLTDRVDIGVVRLGRRGRPPYPEVHKFAMDVSYLSPSRLPRAGKTYSFNGYPETKNRFRPKYRDVLAVPYSYRTESLPESAYRKYGVSPETHIVLPLDVKVGFDSEKKPVRFPKPQGMSGSPMVVLFEDEGESRVFPVVGVCIEYRKSERVVIASDVRFVLEAMRHAA